jgi:hypothetical protein
VVSSAKRVGTSGEATPRPGPRAGRQAWTRQVTVRDDRLWRSIARSINGRAIMPISVNLDQGLDKAYEDKSLEDILAAPPSALAGLTDKHDKLLAELGIKTVRELGSNKYFALAGALVALSTKIS